MSPLIVVQFLGLLLSKLTGGLLPTSFLLFGLVGGTGVVVHLVTLTLCNVRVPPAVLDQPDGRGAGLDDQQLPAQQRADLRRQEAARPPLLDRPADLLCGLQLRADRQRSVANLVYGFDHQLYIAAIIGVMMSVVFNYAVTRVFTWR